MQRGSRPMLSGRSRRDSGSRDLPPCGSWQRHWVLNRETLLPTERTSDKGWSIPSRQRLRERTQLGHRFIHGNPFGDMRNAGFTNPTGLSRGSVTRRMHTTMHGVKGEPKQANARRIRW